MSDDLTPISPNPADVARFGGPSEPIKWPSPDEVRANRAAWFAALRGSGYVQNTGQLLVRKTDEPNGFCCLGVAEDVRGCEWVDGYVVSPSLTRSGVTFADLAYYEHAVLSGYGQVWLGLHDSDPHVAWFGSNDDVDDDDDDEYWRVVNLTQLNDEYNLTFKQIADVVEAMGPDWDGSQEQARTVAKSRNDRGVLPSGAAVV